MRSISKPSARNRRRLARAAAVMLVAFSTWSCQERISTHGYVPDPEAVARIEPGVHNRLEVAQFLGTPSTTALFGEETWLYITERRREFAFFKPEIIDQQVVAIAFNDSGVVDSIDEYLLEDGRLVDPVSRTTPTYGKQIGLIEQLLGNVGRFNNEGGKGVKLPGQ